MNLTGTTESLELVTVAGAAVDWTTSWGDIDKTGATNYTPGSSAGSVSGAADTTIVTAPSASTIYRVLTEVTVCNTDATASTTVTIQKDVGGTESLMISAVLRPGETLTYEDGSGWHAPPQAAATSPGYLVDFYKVGSAPEAAGQYYCWAKDTGKPGAWAPGTPGLNGRATDGTASADAGCLQIANAAPSANYLTGLNAATSVACNFLLYDVLWINSGIVVTTTGAQAIAAPVALPARDLNGVSAGEGCMVGLLVTTATTNAAAIANTTLSYTNSAGVPGRTATMASFPATAAVGTVVWFLLPAGDTGIQQADSITLGTSYGGGAISLIIARRLAQTSCALINVGSNAPIDPSAGVRLYDGTCALPFGLMSATTATTVTGSATIAVRA